MANNPWLPAGSNADVTVGYPVGTGDADEDGVEERYTFEEQTSELHWFEGWLPHGSFTITAPTGLTLDEVTAATTGDVDGNGANELYVAVALRNGSQRSGMLLRYDDLSGAGETVLFNPSLDSLVVALATGDATDDGREELYVAREDLATGEASISSSRDGPDETLYKIYGPNPYFDVRAMVVGDPDEDGNQELYVGFEGSAGARIYRWDDGDGTGPRIFGPDSDLLLHTLTVLDQHAQGDRALYAGFERTDEAAVLYRDSDGDATAGFDTLLFAGHVF